MTAPWTSSDSTAAIIPAFVTALQTVEDVKRNKKVAGEKMSFTYADLAAVLEATKAVLTANGLAVTQSASDAGVQTVLLHETGEWLAFPPLTIGAAQNTPQARGSAISYSRRYSMLAVLGIATEDDDGAAASKAPRAQRQPATTSRPHNGPNPGELATSRQITKLQIRMKEVTGVTDRDQVLARIAAIVGRTVDSSKQLTVTEAIKVIDTLDRVDGGNLEFVAADDDSMTLREVA